MRDEYTTLVEVNDRIFSTSIDLSYVYKPFAVPAPSDEKKLVVDLTGKHAEAGTPWDGEKVAHSARKITLETFAVDESASVQVRGGQRESESRADGARVVGMIGDALQNGAADRGRESVRGERDVQAAEQALCTRGHAVHRDRQPDTVEYSPLGASQLCCCANGMGSTGAALAALLICVRRECARA